MKHEEINCVSVHEGSQMISLPTKETEEYTSRRKIAFDDDLHTDTDRTDQP